MRAMFANLGCESIGRWVGYVVVYVWAVRRAAPRCVFVPWMLGDLCLLRHTSASQSVV